MTLIERINANSVHLYKAARLAALQVSPEAFCSTYEREVLLSEEEWRQRTRSLDGKTRVGFLAIENGLPEGLVLCFREESPRNSAEIMSMYVSPAHRRSQVGTELLEAVRVWAVGVAISELCLQVLKDNRRAIAFYERNGFRRVEAGAVIDASPAARLDMVRRLGPPTL